MRNILRKEVISLINMLIFRVLSRALTSRRHQFEKKKPSKFHNDADNIPQALFWFLYLLPVHKFLPPIIRKAL